MALIVQDPQNPTALVNSYQSLVDARSLASVLNIILPDDDDKAEASIIEGFKLIESKEPEMCGERSTDIQGSSYPRAGVVIRCKQLPSDEFPFELLKSQLIAASKSGNGVDVMGGVDEGRSIASEQAGKVSISYFDNGKTGSSVTIPEFDSTIAPLLCKASDGMQFTVARA